MFSPENRFIEFNTVSDLIILLLSTTCEKKYDTSFPVRVLYQIVEMWVCPVDNG